MGIILESYLDNNCKLHRYTYNNIGIYEAFKLNVSREIWLNFLKSKNAKWLPKPEIYSINSYYESYFTDIGNEKFIKLTLPLMCVYLDKKLIKHDNVIIKDDKEIYSDKYQKVFIKKEV